MIEVVRAPVHLVIQDLGFTGWRSIGLPRCGAMDPPALQLGNHLVGNLPGDPAFEWAASGGEIRFTRDVTVAFSGAEVRGRLGNMMVRSGSPVRVSAGTSLEIDRFVKGRFLYICVSPAPEVEIVFGSRSTYAPAAIGGFKGRRLRQGDVVPLLPHANAISAGDFQKPEYSRSTIRVVPGPQSDALEGRLLSYLLETSFNVSPASDRTGYRLDARPATVHGLPQILSEPACEGAIQITDSGTPIVLMADGPTIGGYNKIAVVIGADLPILAQKSPGEPVEFALR